MINVVIPSKLLFSFFYRGIIWKQRLRAFIITNGWSGWPSHFLSYKSVVFLFCFFFKLNPIFLSENRRLTIKNSDQHFRKGSKHFRAWEKQCFMRLWGGFVCVCVYIYLLKYKIWDYFLFCSLFPPTTILFQCFKSLSVESEESRTV